MRRPSVLDLLIAALLLVGVATAVVAAVDGSVALVLVGVGLALLAAVAYLSDRRSRAARRALEKRLQSGFDALREGLAASTTEVTERLDRIDIRVDETQRRLVTAVDAVRLENAEHRAR